MGSNALRGIGLGVGAMVLNVAVAFLWVWIYAIAVAPGHEGAYYQAYAARVAPISAIVFGIPLLFAVGYLTARRASVALPALIPAATYILIDALLLSMAPAWPPLWTVAISYLTKAAAAWLGGSVARRRASA